jgi:hypothetical protein
MEGCKEFYLDGRRTWLVWDEIDSIGYSHRLTRRNDEGEHLWTFRLDQPEAITGHLIEEDVIKIWTSGGSIICLDARTGHSLATTFVK